MSPNQRTVYFVSSVLLSVLFGAVKTEEYVCDKESCTQYADQLLRGIDETISPCDNFYEYACGNLIDEPIPPNSLTKMFLTIQTNIINERVAKLLEGSVGKGKTALKKVQTMYKNCIKKDFPMNMKAFAKQLNNIVSWPMLKGAAWDKKEGSSIKTFDDVMPLLGKIRRYLDVKGALFSLDVGIVPVPNENIMAAYLKMPLVADTTLPTNLGTREAQIKFFNQIKRNLDTRRLNSDLDEILKVAQIIENISKRSNVAVLPSTDLTDLTKVNWGPFFKKAFQNIGPFDPKTLFVIDNAGYFSSLFKTLEENNISPRTLINYELFNIFFKQVIFNFNSNANQRNATVTSHACAAVAVKYYPYAIAPDYANAYIDTKTVVGLIKEMAENIFYVFEQRLESVTWMDKETKARALQKFRNVKQNYLMPAWDRKTKNVNDYYKQMKPGSNSLASLQACLQFKGLHVLQQIVGIKQRETWPFHPLEVNAFFYQLTDAMYFLEGILMRPSFHKDRLRAMNYGSFGVTVGHELTHGFDSNGINYDANGHKNPWLSHGSLENFNQLAQCFIDQYSNLSLTSEDIPGLKPPYFDDGSFTQTENIADNGGLQQAYWAYKKWVDEHGAETLPKSLERFSADQVYFLSYAHEWCTKYGAHPNKLTESFRRDNHSPSKIRVIGSLSNFDKFAEAFHCQTSTPMNRGEKSCRIW